MSAYSPRRREKGLALVLVASLMVIMILTAFFLLQLVRGAGRGAAAILRAATADLSARSGAEYAVARIAQRPRPGPSLTAPSRGDDWLSRDADGTPIERSLNPSYAHGDTWIDTSSVPDGVDNNGVNGVDEGGEIDRILVEGEAVGADRDGDGLPGAWTGRLRCSAPTGARFVLRVSSPEGRIPLNSGLLPLRDGIDNNGNGSVDEGAESDVDGAFGFSNGVADHQDVDVHYHNAIALAIDNLGVLCGVATRRWNVPAGKDLTGDGLGDGDPIRACWIGNDLIQLRPASGYRSWEEVRRTLTTIPVAGGPYTAAEAESIRPYLDLGPYEAAGESSRDLVPSVLRVGARSQSVNLWTVSRRVLESMWTYLVADSPAVPRNLNATMAFSLWSNDLMGTPPPVTLLCPRSGAPYVPNPPAVPVENGRAVSLVLWPEDAGALAGRMILLRQQASPAWRAIRETLLSEGATLFASDWAALSAADPVFRRGWIQAKGELAFQAIAIDPYPSRGAYDTVSTWASWGLDADTGLGGTQCFPVVGFERMRRVPYPTSFDPLAPPVWPLGVTSSIVPYNFANPSWTPNGIKPLALTLAPPSRFEVESWGRLDRQGASATASGFLQPLERLELSCQEDFDNRRGGAFLAGRGIAVREVDAGGWAERFGCVAPSPAIPTTVSLPAASDAGAGVCFRTSGAIGLASIDAGRQGAGAHWPVNADYNGQTESAAQPSWLEYWSEWDPALIPTIVGAPFPPNRYVPRHCFLAAGGIGQPCILFGTTPYKLSGERAMYGFGQGSSDLGGTRLPWGRNDLSPPFSGGAIGAASIEAWMGPESNLAILGGSFQDIRLYTLRSWAAPATPGIRYALHFRWTNASSGADMGLVTPSWFVPDPTGAGTRTPWSHHVMLHFRDGAPEGIAATVIQIRVDGKEIASFPYGNGPMRSIPAFGLKLQSVDEVRFYANDQTGNAKARYEMGRYKRLGRFRSPLYAMGGRFALVESQWTGFAPAYLKSAITGQIHAPFVVSVETFADDLGLFPLGTAQLEPVAEGIADLRAKLPDLARSFRYAVTIDCRDVEGVLDETPVFESLWLTFRRLDGPHWARWTLR